MSSFTKTSDKIVPPIKKRTFDVYVVIRHTRSGDEQRAVLRVRDYRSPEACRELALNMAEEIANRAAADYGHGSASAFKGKLVLAEKPEQP